MTSRIGTSPLLSRFVGYLPDRVIRRFYYRYKFGRYPRLRDPLLFTELVQRRMLEDRSEHFAWTCDELKMKAYAQATTTGVRVPRTYWAGVDLNELTGVHIPSDWIIKPNHRSQAVHFGHGEPDPEDLSYVTAGWLKMYERAYLGEWAYRQARRCLIVEEHIGQGEVLNDYRFYVFNGAPCLIQVESGRLSIHRRRFYTPEWEPLPYEHGYPMGAPEPRPKHPDTMLSAASELGRHFDFIRVDLYQAQDAVYFGELTPYPAGGMKAFRPHSVDVELGNLWRAAKNPSPRETVTPPRLSQS